MRAVWLLAATILVLGTTSCSTHLTHERASQEVASGGPDRPFYEYYLPKQRYTVQVTFRLKQCPSDVSVSEAEIAAATTEAVKAALLARKSLQIRQEAVITEESVIDVAEHYYLTYRDLDSALKTSTFEMSLYPNQTLKSVGATIEDQSAATIKNLVSTGLNLAKIAVGLPAGASAEGATTPLCNAETLKKLEEVQSLNRALRNDNLTQEQRAAMAERLEILRQYLSGKAEVKLEPVRDKPETLSAIVELPLALMDQWFVAEYPDILQGMPAGSALLQFQSEAKVQVAAVAHGDAAAVSARPGRGIVYRSPVPAKILVCSGTCGEGGSEMVGQAETIIAQLGGYRAVLLDNYAFSKNNMTLSFAPNGMLESMAFGSEASLPKVTGLLAGASESGLGFATALDAAKAKERAAKETAELNALQSETALLKAQADLIEARKRLLELQGEADDESVQ